MARGGWALNPLVGLVVFALALVLGYAVVTRRTQSKFLAHTELWVYLPGLDLPAQNAMMERLLRENPYGKGARSPINTAEGLVLSDIRLNIGLVLRAKNASCFRPDLEDSVEPTADQLRYLAESKSLVRLRFISDVPLLDKRHLQFLLHAAEAYAELGEAKLIYDRSANRFWDRSQLVTRLRESLDVTDFDTHVRLIWSIPDPENASVSTAGLAKLGLDEMVCHLHSSDQRTIVEGLVGEFAAACWTSQMLLRSFETERLGIRFLIEPEPKTQNPIALRIIRVTS
ncbi:MAG: hypothetical protein ACOYON_09645 [Fimbriimonas sp.]